MKSIMDLIWDPEDEGAKEPTMGQWCNPGHSTQCGGASLNFQQCLVGLKCGP